MGAVAAAAAAAAGSPLHLVVLLLGRGRRRGRRNRPHGVWRHAVHPNWTLEAALAGSDAENGSIHVFTAVSRFHALLYPRYEALDLQISVFHGCNRSRWRHGAGKKGVARSLRTARRPPCDGPPPPCPSTGLRESKDLGECAARADEALLVDGQRGDRTNDRARRALRRRRARGARENPPPPLPPRRPIAASTAACHT